MPSFIQQSSGAYILRPDGSPPHIVARSVSSFFLMLNKLPTLSCVEYKLKWQMSKKITSPLYSQPCGLVVLTPHPKNKGLNSSSYFMSWLFLFIYFETVLFICRCPCRFIVDHCLMRFANNLIHGSTRSTSIGISPYNFFSFFKMGY